MSTPELPQDWHYHLIENQHCARNDVDFRFAMLTKRGNFVFGCGQDRNQIKNPLAEIPSSVIEYLQAQEIKC